MTRDAKPPAINRITGIDNVSAERELRPGAVRELVNVDLTPKGMPKRREGYINLIPATEAHSLVEWMPAGNLAVIDGVLTAFDHNLTQTPIRAGLPAWPEVCSYQELGEDLFWTNGREFRRIKSDLTDTAAWPDLLGAPTLLGISGVGGLTAGTYQLALTVLDADGRESGATAAELVDVPEGGGIQITDFPSAIDAVAYRVYLSPPNGDLLEWVKDVAVGTSLVLIGAAARSQKLLETQFLVPMPPGHLLAAMGGRLLMAYENEVYISEAYRYGLCNPDRSFKLPGRVTLLQPCGDADDVGCFVSGAATNARTLYFSGPDPVSGSRRVVYPHGAVPGSALTVPGTLLGLETTRPCAVWLSTAGVFVAGLPGGQVLPLTEGQCALPTAERAAAMVREKNGLRQILLALQGQVVASDRSVFTDAAVTTVHRNGVEI